MATVRKGEVEQARRPVARTPAAREQQLIVAAVDLAERQLLEGTASAQVITHYLKQATMREQLELERLRNENLLTQAKIEQMASQAHSEAMYAEALAAMSTYKGRSVEERPDD